MAEQQPAFKLHAACERGSLGEASAVIQQYGEKVCGVKDKYGCLPIHYACQHSDEDALELVKLVSNQCNVIALSCVKSDRAKDDIDLHWKCKHYGSVRNKPSGQTPLHVSCRAGNSDVVSFLLKRNKFLTNCSNQTPLHIACLYGNLCVAKLVIKTYDYDRMCNHQDSEGCLPLHYACLNNSPELVQLVSEGGTGVNVVASVETRNNSVAGQTPLHIACKSNNSNVDAVMILLGKTSQASDILNGFKQTLLHVACIGGNVAVAKLLIKKYGNDMCTVQDSHRCLPIHYACQHDSLELVKLVSGVHVMNVRACVNPWYKYYGDHSECMTENKASGQTPLHVACLSSNLSIDVITFLLDNVKNAKFNGLLNCFRQTLLHVSCIEGNVSVAELLIERYGNDMCTIRDSQQCLPLHYACQKASVELVTLVSKQCEASAISCVKRWYEPTHALCKHYGKQNIACGQTPLHLATIAGHVNVAKFLLKKCTNKQYDGLLNCQACTLLHVACKHGHVRIAKMLCNMSGYGMCSVQDNDGCLPLHYACQTDSLELVNLASKSCCINTLSKENETPLHVACKAGNPMAVKSLFNAVDSDVIDITHKNKGKIAFEFWPDVKQQLHEACRSGVPELVKYLVKERKCDSTITDRCGKLKLAFEMWPDENKSFHDACRSGVMELIRHLIVVREYATSLKDNINQLPLHIACQERALRMVQLVSSNCDVNQTDKVNGYTPLHIACKGGEMEIAKYLVSVRDSSTLVEDLNGRTPFDLWPLSKDELRKACTRDFPELVGYLFKQRKCVPSVNPFECWPYKKEQLHSACRSGVVELIQYLLVDRQCDTNVLNKKGELPLHIACTKRSLKLVQLVGNVRDVNVAEIKNGCTPLHIACQTGDCDVIKYLVVSKESDLNICDKFGQIPFQLLPSEGNTSKLLYSIVKQMDHIPVKLRSVISERNVWAVWPTEEGQLHNACRWGWSELVKYLIVNRKCDTTLKNESGKFAFDLWPEEDQLHEACRGGIPELVKHLVEIRKCNVDHKNENGKKAFEMWPDVRDCLHNACRSGVLRLIEYLVDVRKCSTGFRDDKGQLPLHIACQEKSLKMVQLVSSSSYCDVNTTDSVNGYTPLHIACKEGEIETTKYLISEKHCSLSLKDVEDKVPFDLWPSSEDKLHTACRSGIPELVNYLVKVRKCDFSVHNWTGWPNNRDQLHNACRSGVPELVKYLIVNRKCDTTLKNEDGKLAFELWPEEGQLHEACRAGIPELVKYLVEVRKCDFDMEDKNAFEMWPDGSDCLHNACRSGVLRLIEYLIDIRMCSTGLKDDKGQLPLHIACQEKSLKMVQLVSDNCDVNTTESVNGYTPLHIACKGGEIEITKYLISEKHCSLSLKDVEDKVPFDLWPPSENQLHITCRSGIPELVNYLVKVRKCDFSIRNWTGKIAFEIWPNSGDQLHKACRSGVPELVKYLIVNRKCDTNFKNDNGNVAFDLWPKDKYQLHEACRGGIPELVKYLVEVRNCDLTVDGDLAFELWPNNRDQLHEACRGSIPELVKYLVTERKCDITIQNLNGKLAFELWPNNRDQLYNAYRSGVPELVRYLIVKRKCDTTVKNKDGKYAYELWPYSNYQLHEACRSGVPELVKYLIVSRKCDTTLKDENGKLAFDLWPEEGDQLHEACRGGIPELVKYLVRERKCDITLQNSPCKLWPNNRDRLHEACRSGVPELVKYLIVSRKCDTTLKENGVLAFDLWPEEDQLHEACRGGIPELVNYLVKERKCDFSTNGKLALQLWPNNRDQLHDACKSGIPELVKYLLAERECDIARKNSDGKVAFQLWPTGIEQLHEACRGGIQLLKLIEHLVNVRKCDTKIQDDKGQLPLHIACQQKSLEMVQLVSINCDVNTTDCLRQSTPLHIACKEGESEIIMFLLTKECSLYIKNMDGKTPFDLWPPTKDQLHKACAIGFPELVGYLVKERKCSPARSAFELWPKGVSLACKSGVLELVEYLTKVRRCDVNEITIEGNTPLHIACNEKATDIIHFLTSETCAKHDVQDRNGELPLHIACRKLTLPEVELLSSNCNVNTTSGKGERPIDIAAQRNSFDIVRFLADVRKCDISTNRGGENALLKVVTARLKSMETKPLKIAKLMITGAPGVGKSSFLKRLTGELILAHLTSEPTSVMIKHITHTHVFAEPTSDGRPWVEVGTGQQMISLMEESGQNKEVDRLLRESVNIHVMNAGGQPEFHRIFPTLVAGPAINLILFKLNEELWERCVIELVHKDGSFEEPCVTSYTHENIIFQTISSVTCFTQPPAVVYSYENQPSSEVQRNIEDQPSSEVQHDIENQPSSEVQHDIENQPSSEDIDNQPVCVLVGTHNDKVNDIEDRIGKINDYLNKKLGKVYTNCEGLVEKYAGSTVAAISNQIPDDNESGFTDLRAFLTKLVHEKCQVIRFPPRWFPFQLHIAQSGKDVMKLKACRAIARECGIETDEEFEAAITYLHYYVGTVLWYRQVEWFKDLVIVHIQAFHDRITDLMANTFTKTNVNDIEYTLFRTKGQFTQSALVRESKKKPGCFLFENLIRLLEYLHIATCIKKSAGGKKKKKETMYFMPSVLRSVEVESLIHSNAMLPHPLLIQFDCGFCPVGVFCFLIVELLKCLILKWELSDDETQYSNMVVMRVGGGCDVVQLIEKNTFYEIRIEEDPSITSSIPYHTRCHEVKECIHQCLQNVTKRLNYSRLSEHRFAFFCPRVECQKRYYTIAVERDMGSEKLKCLACKRPSQVPNKCLFWYGKEGIRIDPAQFMTHSPSKKTFHSLGKFFL